MIDWMKRCKKDETEMAYRRTWRSRCGRYKVEESDIKYGKGEDRYGNPLGYPIYYRAMAFIGNAWAILSIHRKRSAAIKQCEHLEEKGCLIPKKKKLDKRKK